MNRSETPKILLPPVHSKENYLSGFWLWVECLAQHDYQRAIESLDWPDGHPWRSEDLKKQITTFFGGPAPWTVIIPNDRLVAIVNEAAEFQPPGSHAYGWFLAHVPVTNSNLDPKDDAIPLQGLATSFFVRSFGEQYAMSIEIFHA
jgi:hypothetical protein